MTMMASPGKRMSHAQMMGTEQTPGQMAVGTEEDSGKVSGSADTRAQS